MYTAHTLLDVHARAHESLRRLIVFCGALTDDELRRPVAGFGWSTVQRQLEHTIGAEVYWQTVVTRGYTEEATLPELPDVAALEAFRQQTAFVTRSYLERASEAELNSRRADDQRSRANASASSGGCDHACRDAHLQPPGTGARDVPNNGETERHR